MGAKHTEPGENNSIAYYFAPPPVRSLAIIDSDKRYPVRRIYCIGRNYPRPLSPAEQASSTSRSDKATTVIFDKYTDSIVEEGVEIRYPQGTTNLMYEVEMVIAIGKEAANIDPDKSLMHVFGYAVGNDLTRGDLMKAALESGGAGTDPGKAFDGSAPCGPIYPASSVGHIEAGRIWLTVDGNLRQEGDLKDMMKKPKDLVSELSHLYHLLPGDLIYTGTPGMHGTISKNQTMVCGIDGLGTLTNKII